MIKHCTKCPCHDDDDGGGGGGDDDDGLFILRPSDRQITQQEVLDILPLVTEVNAISEELNKYRTFDVVLMTVAGHDGTTDKGTKLVRPIMVTSGSGVGEPSATFFGGMVSAPNSYLQPMDFGIGMG